MIRFYLIWPSSWLTMFLLVVQQVLRSNSVPQPLSGWTQGQQALKNHPRRTPITLSRSPEGPIIFQEDKLDQLKSSNFVKWSATNHPSPTWPETTSPQSEEDIWWDPVCTPPLEDSSSTSPLSTEFLPIQPLYPEFDQDVFPCLSTNPLTQLSVQNWSAVPEGCYSSPNSMTPPLVDDLQSIAQFDRGKQQVAWKK